jgi:hypothetical protein
MNADDRARRDLVLTALASGPLDRIRLMKSLFLLWHRSRRPEPWPFRFKPYMYGPCAFSLYSTLAELEAERLVARAGAGMSRWDAYHLTDAGRGAATVAAARLPGRTTAELKDISGWAASRSFRGLLDAVYAEAPDFATASVLRTNPRTS